MSLHPNKRCPRTFNPSIKCVPIGLRRNLTPKQKREILDDARNTLEWAHVQYGGKDIKTTCLNNLILRATQCVILYGTVHPTSDVCFPNDLENLKVNKDGTRVVKTEK